MRLFTRHKYGAKRTTLEGITFDSKAEARRWMELRLLEKAGEIFELEPHPKYPIVIKNRSGRNVLICTYEGDFRYREGPNGLLRIEDVKSKPTRTAVYRLKKKLVETIYGIEILEISV